MAFNKGMFFETNYCRGDPHSPFISNSQKKFTCTKEKDKKLNYKLQQIVNP
jgi:hypothetical protein